MSPAFKDLTYFYPIATQFSSSYCMTQCNSRLPSPPQQVPLDAIDNGPEYECLDQIYEAIPSVAERSPSGIYDLTECPAYSPTVFQNRAYGVVALTNETKKSVSPKLSEFEV